MADAMERALLLPGDMANLWLMRKHEVFLSLKRNLTLISSLIASLPLPFPFFFPFFFFFYSYLYFFIFILTLIFFFLNLRISSSLKGCPVLTQAQGDCEQLSLYDEGRGGQAHCCHKGF